MNTEEPIRVLNILGAALHGGTESVVYNYYRAIDRTKDNVQDLYQAMDVFLLPSLYEGLGMVAIEAQSAGLPCVLSDNVPHEAIVVKIDDWNISMQAADLQDRYLCVN